MISWNMYMPSPSSFSPVGVVWYAGSAQKWESWIVLEYSGKSWLPLRVMHLALYSSSNALLLSSFLCSSHTKTCFFTVNELCESCLQTYVLWHSPNTCFPADWCAPGNKHCVQNPLLFNRLNRWEHDASTNSLHEKYWMDFLMMAVCWNSLFIYISW